jgi:hypothetical protein
VRANAEQVLSQFKARYMYNPLGNPSSDNFIIEDAASVWIWWWFRYFKENADYAAYCSARRDDDIPTCTQLENQFDQISELYADWGDIHALKSMPRNERSWKIWLHEHRHLFFSIAPSIKHIASDDTEIEHGNIALQIPEAISKSEAMRLFSEFADHHYSDSELIPEQTPKYRLYAPEGRIDQSTFQLVKKAYYVHVAAENHERHPETYAGTALEIMHLELKSQLGFNWELEPDQQERLNAGTFSMLELESFKKQIARFKSNYEAYVANTIHGIFPKK